MFDKANSPMLGAGHCWGAARAAKFQWVGVPINLHEWWLDPAVSLHS